MEALSAIGSATIFLQFFQYCGQACDLVSNLREDRRGNFYEGLFADLGRNFATFNTHFRNLQNVEFNPRSYLNQEALGDALIENCHSASTELRNILFKLAIDDVIKNNNVHLRIRVRRVKEYWKQPEIDRLLSKFGDYEKQLVKSTLAHVSNCPIPDDLEYEGSFRNGYHNRGKIVDILAVAEEFLSLPKGANGQPRPDSGDAVGIHEAIFTGQPVTAMAAVLTFQNGDTKFLTRKGIKDQDQASKGQVLMNLQEKDLVATIGDFRYVQDLVLDNLFFRQCHERRKTVRDAHQETYEWIFCPPEAGKPWAPFDPWLESGSGCYYISGKPGSGKSTLMKFVSQNKRTTAALEKWAGGTPVMASFFFWNLGSPLQKSSIGLLRGLLHDLLLRLRSLIAIVMPDLWLRATQLAPDSDLDQHSLEDLKRWIRKLLSEETTSMKFFIVIDGIDEFEGEHDDLVNLIRDIVKNKNVKILLSSRPTTLSEDSFSAYPKLRLQDLTRGDIQKYAEDHLSGRLEQMHGTQWAALITEITERSHGVFLWVVLVVQSLKEGLREGDSIKEMGDRLNELPGDLKDLYDHIIKNLSSRYQRQASEMFQLLLQAQQVQSAAGYPLLLQLSFCDTDPDEDVSLSTMYLDSGSNNISCEQYSNRIRSRSRGLIESREWETNRISGVDRSNVSSTYVDFIHRTVVEFLRLPDVWQALLKLTATPRKYDPSPQLFRSCLMMCKILPTPRGIDTEISTLWHMMDRGLVFASMAEDSGTPVNPKHLKQLDATVMNHWEGIMKCFSRKASCDIQGHWAKGYTVDPQRQNVLNPDNFASVALFHGLEDYLTKELADPASVMTMNTTLLLIDALRYIGSPPWETQPTGTNLSLTSEAAMFLDREVIIRPRWVNIAIELLQVESTHPNEPIGDIPSAWNLMLTYVEAASCTQRAKQIFHRDLGPEGFANSFSRLLAEFIMRGADLNLCILPRAEPAWKLIERLFSADSGRSQRLDPWARQPVVPVNTNVTTMRDYFQELLKEYGANQG